MKITLNLTPAMVEALKKRVVDYNVAVDNDNINRLDNEKLTHTDIKTEVEVLMVLGLVNDGILKSFTDAYR